AEVGDGASPLSAASLVGLSYFLGASLPVLPVFLGATGVAISAAAAAAAVTVVSAGLAFLSGMDMGRRVLLNLGIVAGAVAMTSLLGSLAHRWLGVSL
ncbi:MAG TPA: rubrerythrin family protein, partial [Elusimicrobiota bacterium]|nr:rubrerythrin family protein [Elusimicrobiota bacterium]